MNYKYYRCKLKTGHIILTPTGEEISDSEFREFFRIISTWLKEVRPNAFIKIAPAIDKSDYGQMLSDMFEAYQYDPDEGGCKERYFLDPRTLAFIYVVSYFIQKENTEEIEPLLAHVMGNALLEWLPDIELVEHYLAYSANPAHGSNLSDGNTLFRMFAHERFFRVLGVDKDYEKAFKYSAMNYHNPTNKHGCNNSDLFYAKSLFRRSNFGDVDEALDIINQKLDRYDLFDEDEASTLAQYLLLKIEISSQIKSDEAIVDLDFAEKYFSTLPYYSICKNEGLYWIAKCHIAGLNNTKDIEKGRRVLAQINDPYLYKKAGALIARTYLNDFNYEEASASAWIAELQGNRHCYDESVGEKEIDDVLFESEKNSIKAKYVRLLRRVLQRPIHDIDIDGVDHCLKLALEENEFDYLMNDYDFDKDEDRNIFLQIARKLRHPVISRKLFRECNKMVYLGTNNEDSDLFLNFEKVGNIFIHGWCGAGKTWYLNSIYRRLKEKECYKGLGLAVWSFKPFEFENWCNDYLVRDPHLFIERIKFLSEDDSIQKVIFIDELSELLDSINDNEKNTLKQLMKDSEENNICFICCSQNMTYLMKEYDEYATTKICMECGNNEDDSLKMLGRIDAASLDKQGEMYVFNPHLSCLPMKTKVIRKRC